MGRNFRCEVRPGFMCAANIPVRQVATGQRSRIDRLQPLLVAATNLKSQPKERTRTLAVLADAYKISLRQLYRLLENQKRYGDLGLGRKKPSNAGKARVQISRVVDGVIADPAVLAVLSAQLDLILKGLWKGPASAQGIKAVQGYAGDLLLAYCADHGIDAPPGGFDIPRYRAERYRNRSIVHVSKTDPKQFADGYPRIRRDWPRLDPMELVIADVKHLDVLVQRQDGSTSYPKMIAFQDGATGRVFVHVLLLEQGQGVRREHVAEAFIAMASHPRWGFPDNLMIDRGSEFKIFDHLADVFASLNADGVKGVLRTAPYRPQSKPIEGWFGQFDAWGIQVLPGYVGPDRLNKKVETQGKPKAPYPQDFQHFRQTVLQLVKGYSRVNGGGRLNGQSPEDSFSAYLGAGWKPRKVDKNVLKAAFYLRETRRIDRGHLKIAEDLYVHDALFELPHRTEVEVALPFGSKGQPMFRVLGEQKWMTLAPDDRFHPLDVAGAKESERRQKRYRKMVREWDHEVPTIDPLALRLNLPQADLTPMPRGCRPAIDFGSARTEIADALVLDRRDEHLKDVGATPHEDPALARLRLVDGPLAPRLVQKAIS